MLIDYALAKKINDDNTESTGFETFDGKVGHSVFMDVRDTPAEDYNGDPELYREYQMDPSNFKFLHICSPGGDYIGIILFKASNYNL